ncbi:MAG: AMP-binding protein [Chloroflexi bacterium]|nr:AMP-binding protein [Chloroflexota bacterium]
MATVPAGLCTTGSDTVAGVLARQAQLHGNNTFFVFEDAAGRVIERTYGEVDERATRFAQVLQARGVGPGDNFHVHLANCLEFFDCWFGAARLGAVMVPTNPLSTAHELSYVLEHAGCRLSVTSPDLSDTVRLAGELDHLLATGPDFEAALAAEDAQSAQLPGTGALDPVGMLYTSGTTSLPKGVLVTNANYLFVGNTVAQYLRLWPDDRHLVVLPLFHANAQYYSTMSALVTGASVAVMDRFSASRWSQQAARHRATIASLFAAPVRMILAQEPNPADRQHSLRVALFAQNVSEEQLSTFEARFGVGLLQIYGMTETVALPTLNPLCGDRRNMTIGRPSPWSRLRVVDAEGCDVATGEVGELLVGGDLGTTLMAGYFKNPKATAETFRDGWLHTGDNVRFDADGYLHFVDRGKDMIKRAGENVASGEVERVLNAHPAVFESAVIGVPDPIRDEAILAVVVLNEGARATEAELIAWCADRLSKFRVPSFVRFTETLPRTSVGKVQKHLLRKQAQESERMTV